MMVIVAHYDINGNNKLVKNRKNRNGQLQYGMLSVCLFCLFRYIGNLFLLKTSTLAINNTIIIPINSMFKLK